MRFGLNCNEFMCLYNKQLWYAGRECEDLIVRIRNAVPIRLSSLPATDLNLGPILTRPSILRTNVEVVSAAAIRGDWTARRMADNKLATAFTKKIFKLMYVHLVAIGPAGKREM